MTKATTKLSAQDHVILFCVATGTDHASVGILPQAMQSMALRGFIEHDRETGAYRLADSGRATLAMILDHAGIKSSYARDKSVMPVRLPLVIERLLLGGVFSYALDPLARPGDPIHLERLRIRHVLMQDWITSLRSHNAVRLVGVIKRYRHEPCSLEGRWRRTASRKLAAIKGVSLSYVRMRWQRS